MSSNHTRSMSEYNHQNAIRESLEQIIHSPHDLKQIIQLRNFQIVACIIY